LQARGLRPCRAQRVALDRAALLVRAEDLRRRGRPRLAGLGGELVLRVHRRLVAPPALAIGHLELHAQVEGGAGHLGVLLHGGRMFRGCGSASAQQQR
jgi:hypothetical protein